MIDTTDVTAVIKAFMRPIKFEKCIKAAIDAGIVNVIVGYDGPENLLEVHTDICNRYNDLGFNVNFIGFDFNAGISKVRNNTVKAAKTDYILILDDDNYIPCNVTEVINFLRIRENIGAVAFGWILPDGRIQIDAWDIELVESSELVEGSEDKILQQGKYLFRTFHNPKKVEYLDGLTYIHTFDFIPNCALFKRAVFDDILWDERFIISGEHEDFYLQAKQTQWDFAICPSIFAYHDFTHDPKFAVYRRGSENQKSYKYLLDKWGLKGYIPLRTYSQLLDGAVYTSYVDRFNKEVSGRILDGRIKYYDHIKF